MTMKIKRTYRFGGLVLISMLIAASVGSEAFFRAENPYLYCNETTNKTNCYEGGKVIFNLTQLQKDPYAGGVFWDDQSVPVESVRLGSTNPPNFVSCYTNQECLQWDDTLLRRVYGNVQTKHGWVQGTDYHAHVHFSPATDTANNITFCFDIVFAGIGANFTTSNRYCATDTAYKFANTHYLIDVADINMSNVTGVSAIIKFSLFRNTSDSYTGSVNVHDIDFHYAFNAPGSTEEFAR